MALVSRKPVLITGGTGFVGSRLALRLARSGVRVRVMGLVRRDDEIANADELNAAGVEVIDRCVTTIEDGDPIFTDIALVFHLAAIQHEINLPDERFHAVNVEGTAKLLSAAASARINRLVHVSTIGIWGERQGELDEDVTPSPDTIYGRTKLAAEVVVNEFRGDLETVIIRLGEIYGPGDMRLLKLFKMAQTGKSLIIGEGRNRHHPIFIDDAIDALLRAASLPAANGETFVLAGNDILTSRQMIYHIAEAINSGHKVRYIPLTPMLALATAMELILRPLGIQPPLHRRRLGFFTKDQTINPNRIAAVLGHVSKIPFKQGAAMTGQWYCSRGLLENYSAQPPSTNKSIPVT